MASLNNSFGYFAEDRTIGNWTVVGEVFFIECSFRHLPPFRLKLPFCHCMTISPTRLHINKFPVCAFLTYLLPSTPLTTLCYSLGCLLSSVHPPPSAGSALIFRPAHLPYLLVELLAISLSSSGSHRGQSSELFFSISIPFISAL